MSKVQRVFVALAVFAALASARPHAADNWVEVVSPNFRVVSNAGEGMARSIAWQFEQIRSGIQAGWPWARGRLDRPFLVIAVKDENSLKLLAPRYWEAGNRVRPGSVSATAPDRHYVAMRTDLEVVGPEGTNPYRSAYWAYTQTVLSDSFSGGLPFWFSRGLSAVLSNTIITDREVQFGRAIRSYVDELQLGRYSLPELLTMTRDSPAYVREIERHRFDAQCWALVHHMIFGEADRAASGQRLNEFVRLTVAGMTSLAAVDQLYGGVVALDAAYRLNLERGLLRFASMAADAKVVKKDFRARPMTAPEALAVRAEYHVATDRMVEAKAEIEELKKAAPIPAAAFAAEGRMYERERQSEPAKQAFARAAEFKSDNFYVYWRLGSLSLGPGATPESLAAARGHLGRAIELNPDSGFVHSTLGAVLMQLNLPAEAVEAYRKATTLEAGDANLRLSLANVLVRAGRREDALKEAQAALALARTPQQRLAAQNLIDRLK